jgi:glycosyltransferase involved in cell wall biosynthesis
MIIFVDQSGQWGGGELCLHELVSSLRGEIEFCVFLFETGPFADKLMRQNVKLVVADGGDQLTVRRGSNLLTMAKSFPVVTNLMRQLGELCGSDTLLYANSQKAAVICFLIAAWKKVPVVWHLRDILSAGHFSWWNRLLVIVLSNFFCREVIVNSEATRAAYMAAGGKRACHVIYSSVVPEKFLGIDELSSTAARERCGIPELFTIGIFGRIAEWKGQHVLIEALTYLEGVQGLIVGDALFEGDEKYQLKLNALIGRYGLQDKITFVGFQEDIATYMAACDVVVHASVEPEPFGRVIVEAMRCRRPVIAARGGGAVELVGENEERGWLHEAGSPASLRDTVRRLIECDNVQFKSRTEAGFRFATDRCNPDNIRDQVFSVIERVQGSRA